MTILTRVRMSESYGEGDNGGMGAVNESTIKVTMTSGDVINNRQVNCILGQQLLADHSLSPDGN